MVRCGLSHFTSFVSSRQKRCLVRTAIVGSGGGSTAARLIESTFGAAIPRIPGITAKQAAERLQWFRRMGFNVIDLHQPRQQRF